MKVSTPLAFKGKLNSQNLSFPVVQTLGINETRCVGCINMEQGERVHVNLNQFSRFSPLVAPTFGDFKIKTHAFWVPTRLVWAHYGEFLDDSLDASFDAFRAPLNFSLRDFYETMYQYGFMELRADFDTPDGYAKKGDGTPLYDVNEWEGSLTDGNGASYNFSDFGRKIFASMQALGYALPLYYRNATQAIDADAYAFYTTEKYSLYPLLSLFRCFYDWLYPSQYVTQQGLGMFFLDDFHPQWRSGTLAQRQLWLSQMFTLLYNAYDKSFFTSLWAKPNQIAQNTTSGRGQSKISNFAADPVFMDRNGVQSTQTSANRGNVGSSENAVLSTPRNVSSTSFQYQLSADSLRWLESVSDFVLRSNIGGTRVREFLKSHFGYAPSEMMNCSTWLRTFTDKVVIQDVTNMSATSAVLGEQGGKAVSSGNGSLKFEASERGMLIFITQVEPRVAYYQGLDKYCRAIKSRFDMYLPDFDSVSMVAVPRSSLFNQYRQYEDMQKVPITSQEDVLGYAPNDAERKNKNAILNGDFIFNSRNLGLDSYHTFRDVLFGRNNLAIDSRFLEVDNQAQRIFAYVGSPTSSGQYAQYDKIFNEMFFDVTKYSHAKSLSESMPFFDEAGKRVNLEYQGSEI